MKSRLQSDLARSDSASAQYGLLLLVLALATDLLTPFLIWKGILPASTRWVSHAAVVAMMAAVYVRMMVFDRVPLVVLVIAGVSVIGVSVALFAGQGIVPTLWGWWVMFQYPLVGLYAYLQPQWPERFPQRLRLTCAAILGLQVIVQIGQYLTGEQPGDNLAGTFGRHGVGPLVIFIIFALCLALGQWLARGEWKTLAWVLAMGSISSTLGEMKLFLFAAVALGMMAIAIFVFRGGHFGRLFELVPYVVLLGAVVSVFLGFYNAVVPRAEQRPLESYLELGNLDHYLGNVELSDSGKSSGRYYGRSELGRNYALIYGWNTIRRDTRTFLFGLGLGARGESRSLGTAGQGLLEGGYGLTTGTSLLVILQELGLMGQVVFGGFVLLTVVTMSKDIKRYPRSEAMELRYALVLFSLLWPVWVWYQSVWTQRVPMLLYWATLGYTLGEAKQCQLLLLTKAGRLSIRETC